jgi:hypothetical protein
LRPCINNFDEGLLFIGSVTEVSTTVPEPPPPIDNNTTTSRGRGLQQKNNDNGGGWMSTKVNTLMSTTNVSSSRPRFGGGNINSQPSRQSSATIATLSKETPKETPLQKYLKGNKTVKSVKHSIYPSKSNVIKDVKSVGYDGSKIDNAMDSAAIGSSSRKRYVGSIAITANTMPVVQQPNPFTAYTYDKIDETKVRFDATTFTQKEIELSMEKEREKESSTSKRVVTDKTMVMMKSPFFSSPAPTNFDYGGFTPLVERDIAVKSDDSNSNTKEKVSTRSRRSDECLTAALIQQQQLFHQYTDNDKTVTRKNDTSFDYGIIMESPRRSPRRKASPNSSGVLRSYIDQTLNSDKPGPRRVSKSLSEGMRSEGKSSPEDVIDLIDDDESIPNASSPVKENYPNCEKRDDKVAKNVTTSSSSTVTNLQKFRIPYPSANQKRLTTSSYSTHNSSTNKTRATISSSALLAGFARQKEICPASSSRSSGTKSKFFPIKSNNTKNLKKWFAAPSIENEGEK